MADPVLKFPPEAKDAPSGRPSKKLAAEPRRRLLAGLRQRNPRRRSRMLGCYAREFFSLLYSGVHEKPNAAEASSRIATSRL